MTGAGNGIGLAITEGLLKSAKVAHIVAVDLQTRQLETLEKDSAGRLHILQGDVTQNKTNERAVQLAVEKGGQVNSIILNAAVVRPIGPLAKLALDDWKKTFDVNFFSSIDLVSISCAATCTTAMPMKRLLSNANLQIQQALPELRKVNGSILMTTTRVCWSPTESWTCYASTKAVVNYFCSCLPLEEPQVRSIAVSPGAVATENMAGITKDRKRICRTRSALDANNALSWIFKEYQPVSARPGVEWEATVTRSACCSVRQIGGGRSLGRV